MPLASGLNLTQLLGTPLRVTFVTKSNKGSGYRVTEVFEQNQQRLTRHYTLIRVYEDPFKLIEAIQHLYPAVSEQALAEIDSRITALLNG